MKHNLKRGQIYHAESAKHPGSGHGKFHIVLNNEPIPEEPDAQVVYGVTTSSESPEAVRARAGAHFDVSEMLCLKQEDYDFCKAELTVVDVFDLRTRTVADLTAAYMFYYVTDMSPAHMQIINDLIGKSITSLERYKRMAWLRKKS